MSSSGDITIGVVPSCQGLLSCSTIWPARLRLSRSLAIAGRVISRHRRSSSLRFISATAYCRMQAKTVRVDAARLRGVARSAGDGLQAQYFLPCVWPQRNAIGAGGRLQGRERAIRLGLGQVAHALLFDEVAGARQQLDDALDDPVEQRLELCRAGSARFMEHRRARAAAIHPIEHQTVQMDVEIGRRAEALDERDCTAVSLGAWQSRLFDQKGGNDAVNALQQR